MMSSVVKWSNAPPPMLLGVTMDQVVAQQLGRQTAIPSLVLGCEQPRYGTDQGYAGLFGYISWSSPTTPVPKIYPQLAFDRLFADGAQRQQDRASWTWCWRIRSSSNGASVSVINAN